VRLRNLPLRKCKSDTASRKLWSLKRLSKGHLRRPLATELRLTIVIAIRALEYEIADRKPAQTISTASPSPSARPREVFVVHGHDEGAREAVARFLQTMGFKPIILYEQANKGRTVIEKVVEHGDVGFAVVLLTPDDESYKKGEAAKPRARQNVLLELGYFIGRLGRQHV
jgi:predicted nucleotide-binding protein